MILVSAESSSGRGSHSEPREHRLSGDKLKSRCTPPKGSSRVLVRPGERFSEAAGSHRCHPGFYLTPEGEVYRWAASSGRSSIALFDGDGHLLAEEEFAR